MTTHVQPIFEVTQRGASALIKEIGVVDTIRFLNQFRAGSGDYSTDCDKLFESLSVEDIVNKIKAQRKLIAQRGKYSRRLYRACLSARVSI